MKLNLTRPINEEKKVYRFNVFRKMVDGSLRKVKVLEKTASSYEEAFNWAEYDWAERFGVGNTPGARKISMRKEYEIHPEGQELFGPKPVQQPVPKKKLGYDPLAMFKR